MSDVPDSRLAQIKARQIAIEQALAKYDRNVESAEGAYGDARGVAYQRQEGGLFAPKYHGALADLRTVNADVPFLIEQVEGRGWHPIASAPKRESYAEAAEPCLMLSAGVARPFIGTAAMYPDGQVRGSVSFGNGGPLDWGVTHFIPLSVFAPPVSQGGE
jgi:hypothetical protein